MSSGEGRAAEIAVSGDGTPPTDAELAEGAVLMLQAARAEIARYRRALRLISAEDTDPCATHESEALRRQRIALTALAVRNEALSDG